MEQAEKEQIARESISELAAKWESTPDAFVSEQDGTFVFTFTLHSIGGATTICFDPLPAATQMIENMGREIASSFDRTIILLGTISRLDLMLRIAARHFADSLEDLRDIADAATSASLLESFGAQKKRTEMVERLIARQSERTRKRFALPGGRGKRAEYEIAPFHVRTAVRSLLHDTGRWPGEAAVARDIFNDYPRHWANENGAKAALRTWYKKLGFKNWKAASEMLKREALE